MNDIFIPAQESGSKSDTSDHKKCADAAEAASFFSACMKRLKNVNGWHDIAGKATAKFQLTDDNGIALERDVQVGDLFRIDLPVTENKKGNGYDWVKVEDMKEKLDPAGDSEFLYFRVRPCKSPLNDSEGAAHFFDPKATSTFLVTREQLTVTAAVHGRNEHANTEEAGIVDKARNLVVAVGAKLGLATPQWTALVKGILEDK